MISPYEREISANQANDIANRQIQVQAMWGELPSQQATRDELRGQRLFSDLVQSIILYIFGKLERFVPEKSRVQKYNPNVDQLNPDGEEINDMGN